MKEESFFEKVYSVVKLIPKGRVTSYGAIGEYLGTKKSARMVGWAMNASHTHPNNIPAHRVVNRYGLLTGKHHFSGSAVMQQLLENEGIEVVNDRITGFEKVFWDPSKELTIDNYDKRTDIKSTRSCPGSGSEERSGDPEHD